MPTYEYYCKTCEIKFDVKQSFDSKPVAKCIEKDCDEECQRQFSVVPVVFKGSGWYVNDYAKKSDSSTSKPAPNKKSSDKTDTKKESKRSIWEPTVCGFSEGLGQYMHRFTF